MNKVKFFFRRSKGIKPNFKKNNNLAGALDFIKSIDQSPWFKKVKKPHPKVEKYLRVHGWGEAIELLPTLWSIRMPFFEKVLRKAIRLNMEDDLNRVTQEIQIYVRKKTGIWNNVVRPIGLNQAYGYLSADLSLAAGSIFMDCQESTEFFMTYIKFYFEGYWPCGYHGVYPTGKFFIF